MIMENLESHELKNFIFQALKVKEFNFRLWEVVENWSYVCYISSRTLQNKDKKT